MNTEDLSWVGDWTVGVRVRVERAGQALMDPGRLELLEEIDRCQSISAAARKAGMSYWHAWALVQEVNRAAGEPLVIAATGGSHGGGARLTPRGRLAVRVFRDLQEHLGRPAASLLPRLLGDPAAASVHVAAAVSLEEVLGQLVIDYTLRQPGARIRAVFGASDELADQLLGGTQADLFLTADPRQLDRLVAAGIVGPDNLTLLAENSLAVVGPAGRPIAARRPGALLGSAVARVALAAPSCPLGGYTRAYLQAMGLYDGLLARALLVDNARAVLAAVRAGQVSAGLVYGSATGSACGCRVWFRVRHIPAPIRYAGAVVHRGQQSEQAKHLLEFLASRLAERRFRRCGFLPVQGRN